MAPGPPGAGFSRLFNPCQLANLPAVSPVARQTFAYWLLLLVPTFGVGVGAIVLLRREQARLAQSAAYTNEARRAAIAARARLIAENAELLVGDVESGLLESLAAAPADRLDPFLDQWEKANPLVRVAFRCAPDGTVLRPVASAADENARSFLRRFARRLSAAPPWGRDFKTEAAGRVRQAERQVDKVGARKDVASNVAKVQSARKEAQMLSQLGNYAVAEPPVVHPAGTGGASSRDAASESRSMDLSAGRPSSAGSAANYQLDAAAAPGRQGWAPWLVDGHLHLLGWVQVESDDVRGVELDLVALIGRLGGALPAETIVGEGYALRDDQGRVLQQAGVVAHPEAPLVRVPLSLDMLPGWEVAAFLEPGPREGNLASGFMLVGSLLVGILVAAIVAGGSLLLWQARRSEADARQKTSFVANVSHEFKTPLTTIRLFAELLEEGRVRDPAQGGEYLRTIGRETQRLARLVNNVLDFSRLEQGRKKYAREPLDIAGEITRLLDTYERHLTEAGLALRRDFPAGPVNVTTDRDAVVQIVLNLLDNVCKYAAAGGEVAVALKPRTAGGVALSVLDRGPGVPDAHRERIFEKFHRVDETLTAERSGAGLGLSIARQLARGLGGELRHEPRPGGGAAFVLELP